MLGKLKSPIPTCPTTLPTAWASSLRLWALRKIFKSMGAVKDSPKISTLKAFDPTDDLISFDGNVFNVSNQNISQNDVDFTKVSWEHSFQLLTHITDVDHLTFSLCGSSHHLGPNLSKQFTPNWCDKNHPKVQNILQNPNSFKLMHSISVKLLVAFYFLFCFAKLQQKKKQKKPTFHFSFLWFISHGPIQPYVFAKVQWLHQWGDSVELLPFGCRLQELITRKVRLKDRYSHENLR